MPNGYMRITDDVYRSPGGNYGFHPGGLSPEEEELLNIISFFVQPQQGFQAMGQNQPVPLQDTSGEMQGNPYGNQQTLTERPNIQDLVTTNTERVEGIDPPPQPTLMDALTQAAGAFSEGYKKHQAQQNPMQQILQMVIGMQDESKRRLGGYRNPFM